MKLAVFSDIHEDVTNLELALRKAERLKCNEIVCLGDIVGFSVPYYNYLTTRNANRCIELISKYCRYVVAGNHDHFAVRKLPSLHPVSNLPNNWYLLSFQKRKEIAQNNMWLYEDNELSALLNEESYEWLSKLPEFLIISIHSYNILLSHFIFPDITGFTTSVIQYLSNHKPHVEFMTQHQIQWSLFGHIHTNKLLILNKSGIHRQVLTKQINESLISIGIPAIASNTNFSGFAILDADKQQIELYKL